MLPEATKAGQCLTSNSGSGTNRRQPGPRHGAGTDAIRPRPRDDHTPGCPWKSECHTTTIEAADVLDTGRMLCSGSSTREISRRHTNYYLCETGNESYSIHCTHDLTIDSTPHKLQSRTCLVRPDHADKGVQVLRILCVKGFDTCFT